MATNNPLLLTLAEFRFQLRTFLHFSECAAEALGLQPQQHQLLLQIAAASDEVPTTIAYAAGRLGLRHNSVVELANRSQREGLLIRTEDARDRRRAVLKLTPKGEQLLAELSDAHMRELCVLAPRLAETLQSISALGQASVRGAGAGTE